MPADKDKDKRTHTVSNLEANVAPSRRKLKVTRVDHLDRKPVVVFVCWSLPGIDRY
jgi:hypothetical protein